MVPKIIFILFLAMFCGIIEYVRSTIDRKCLITMLKWLFFCFERAIEIILRMLLYPVRYLLEVHRHSPIIRNLRYVFFPLIKNSLQRDLTQFCSFFLGASVLSNNFIPLL